MSGIKVKAMLRQWHRDNINIRHLNNILKMTSKKLSFSTGLSTLLRCLKRMLKKYDKTGIETTSKGNVENTLRNRRQKNFHFQLLCQYCFNVYNRMLKKC